MTASPAPIPARRRSTAPRPGRPATAATPASSWRSATPTGDWNTGGWPRQESFFNQRYFWVNGEFTPRETMRGKMALLGYLYGIR